MGNVQLFAFWGRKENIEIQLPFILQILQEHPQVHFVGWNLTQNEADDDYVRGLVSKINTRRFIVDNSFHSASMGDGWNMVYQHYTSPIYSNDIFVKLDDDVIFIETDRFGYFLECIASNRHSVISANVVNNGACTYHQPRLPQVFEDCNIPLLDVHESLEYAMGCHRAFTEHPGDFLGNELVLSSCDTWLSINVIGYDYSMGCHIQRLLGQRSPRDLAGRTFPIRARLGDEGAFNMVPRLILEGFTAEHLTFGPQRIPEDLQQHWRREIKEIGRNYLG